MRRCIALTLVLMTLVLAGRPAFAAAADDPVLPAKAYVLMDATTGQVLHAYDGDTPLPIASTTKIMTAILALERGEPDAIVTAGQKPYDTGGTTIYLEIGEQQKLHDLLLALMLESANDAAVAIAEHLAGSEERFAGWMNEKARAIGATHTHFVNSHGLHDPNHYSSAHDLALIARYAMQNPAFRELITTEEATIPGNGENPPRKLVNHNRLLGYYEGANGVKNGFTEEAGLTNVASARRGDTELIAVVLGAHDRLWTSSMALLDFGFSHWHTVRLVQKGEQVGELPVSGVKVPLLAASDLYVTLRLDSPMPPRQIEPVPAVREVPAGGSTVTRLTVPVDGQVASVDLVAGAAPARPSVAPTNQPPTPHVTGPLKFELLLVAALIVLGVARRRRRRFSA